MELKKSQNDIVRVSAWFNLLVLVISAFYPKLWLFYTGFAINLLLLGTYMIFTKYYFMFAGITAANKFARKINNQIEAINGQIPREI